MPQQVMLHLAWLDPVAADLELPVLAPQELHHPICRPAPQVACAIDSLAVTEGVFHES